MRTALAAALLLSASVFCAADTAARPALRVKREVTKSAVVEKAAPVELRGGGATDVLSKISLPREVQLLIASAGIFMSFSFFAIKQEDVYKRAYGGEYFAYTFFALVIERGINALVALVGMMALGKSGLRIPHLDIFNSGVSQVVAMAASNEALRYVSYPTQVLGKSCKMVPVMAGGIVLGGKTYSTIEYLQVLMITTGVVVFNFGGKKKGGGAADSAYGLVLIGLSLIMDMVCTARAHMHTHTCTCAYGHAHAHGARTLGRPTRALTLAITRATTSPALAPALALAPPLTRAPPSPGDGRAARQGQEEHQGAQPVRQVGAWSVLSK